MSDYVAAFMGGPLSGQLLALQNAPLFLRFPTPRSLSISTGIDEPMVVLDAEVYRREAEATDGTQVYRYFKRESGQNCGP